MTSSPATSAAAPPVPRFWRGLAALAVFGTVAVNYYANTRPFNGQTMGAVSAQYPTPLTPAGYAFGIWGLIFLGLMVYAVWQLLPAQRRLALPDAVARPLAVACAATSAWVVLFAHEQIGLSVGTMLVILAALVLTYGRARRRVLAGTAPTWVSIPFALFLGWIAVATVINLTLGLREITGPVGPAAEQYLAYALLLAVVGLGLVLSRVFRERAFGLVLAWALVGIWRARLPDNPMLGWAALAAGLVLVGGLVLAREDKEARR